MKIYKFKDLSEEKKRPQFYQIVLQNKIWCAKPVSLNDEEEFRFKLNYDPSPRTADLLTEVVRKYGSTNFFPPRVSTVSALQNKRLEAIAAPIIADVIEKSRSTIGIASFSITKADDRLWAEYGGQGNGACVEIDIPDKLLNVSFHQVHYVSEKIFHVDSFLESALYPGRAFETYRNILLTKTKKWSQEKEIRFISKHPEVNVIIDGRITEITLGGHIPAHTMVNVKEVIVEHCCAKGIKITKL